MSGNGNAADLDYSLVETNSPVDLNTTDNNVFVSVTALMALILILSVVFLAHELNARLSEPVSRPISHSSPSSSSTYPTVCQPNYPGLLASQSRIACQSHMLPGGALLDNMNNLAIDLLVSNTGVISDKAINNLADITAAIVLDDVNHVARDLNKLIVRLRGTTNRFISEDFLHLQILRQRTNHPTLSLNSIVNATSREAELLKADAILALDAANKLVDRCMEMRRFVCPSVVEGDEASKTCAQALIQLDFLARHFSGRLEDFVALLASEERELKQLRCNHVAEDIDLVTMESYILTLELGIPELHRCSA
ncbi:hypothetical protein NP233_g7131 [Leucocoprinus birnbaumii]|uniref:Uncharacterized protein n=1 Tax=Leucocoprinus birnbaumii TaxID=56174 RepID=A0AAD5VS64_9AGAR|nr:hypothetical protein NP233_g7131 [Leucocoprinus birnbaumii]